MTEYVASNSLIASADLEQSNVSIPESVRSKPISEIVVASLVAVADIVAVVGAGAVALIFNVKAMADADRHFADVTIVLAALLFVNMGYVMEAYRFDALQRPRQAMVTVLLSWFSTAAVVTAVLQIADDGGAGDWMWATKWLLSALGLLLLTRVALSHLFERWAGAGRLTRYVAIVGAGLVGERIIRHLIATSDRTAVIVGVYEDRRHRHPDYCAGIPIRGSVDDLIADIRRRRFDTVIVTLPLWADRRLAEIVDKLRQAPITVTLCPEWFDLRAGACPLGRIGDVPILRAAELPLRDWRGIVKAIEDRVLATIILLLISPVLAAIAVLIKLTSPGPILFRQKRYGFNNELIEVVKFRSMYHHSRDPNAEQLTRRGDPRVTRIGAFLRRTSLDELPQFINVLRGEMSIVGPRPHALAAKAGGVLYPDAVRFYHARHRVKPGITGWAQVNGWRGETETVEQIVKRVEHDLYYVEHWSVLFDLRIILRTVLGGFTGGHAY